MTKRRISLWMGTIVAALVFAFIALPVECKIQMRRNARQRLVHMLCQTDYQVLLAACRELSHRVSSGDLEPKAYLLRSPLPWPARVTPAPEAASFPKAILDVDPLIIDIDRYGLVRVLLQVHPDQGLLAYPENYRDYDQLGDVELIPDLWFSDGNYRPDLRSEFTKHVDELIRRGKDYQRTMREAH
jgi:hypothetical protein